MIDSAPYEVEHNMEGWTFCYRGYVAEYIIEDDVVYLIDIGNNVAEKKDNGITSALPDSCKVALNYTGSIVIAYNNNNGMCAADFLESYVMCDEAYELYFIDGMLLEEINLQKAIREWKTVERNVKPSRAVL